MVKRLLAATLIVWVAVLCIERSIEYQASEPARTDQGIRRALEKSIPDLVLSLKAAEQRQDSAGIDTAIWQLALTNWQLRRFDRAELFLKRLLAREERAGGTDNHNLVPVLQAAGGVLRDWGKFDGATQYYQRAQQIDALARGPNSTQVSKGINNLGVVSLLDGLAGESEDKRIEALRLSERLFSNASALCAQTGQVDTLAASIMLSNQAIALSELGKTSQGRALASKAEQIRQAAARGSGQ
jgi:tetratricopeptide (TPR) repeat protein